MSDSAIAPRRLPVWQHARRLGRASVGLGFVAVTGALLGVSSASLSVASVSMLVAVVSASLLGYEAGLVAAVSGFVVLNYFFTTPVGSLLIARADDLLVLVAFIVVAVIVAAVVARLTALRLRSERTAREVALRLTLANRLLAGDDPTEVLEAVAGELVTLYDLASCSLASDAAHAYAAAARPPVDHLAVQCGSLQVALGLGRPLSALDSAAITALGTELATALELIRLEDQVVAQRVSVDLASLRAGFLTGVTHDLRTPLATIKAAAGTLLVDDAPLEAGVRRELLESVYEGSAHLEGLVTKVLEFTRARAGDLQLERASVAPGELAAAAAARLARVAADQPIEVDVDPCVPAVDVDPVLLEHVMVNLLENALRYSTSGDPVQVEALDAGEAIELRVVDHGPGIPDDQRERVFEEFVRLRPREGGGIGLGLAIVQGLVAAHDGQVWCEATPGGGATFVVSLPVSGPGAS